VTTVLPAGTWSPELVSSFFHGERLTYAVLAVLVGAVTTWGALSLTDSRSVDEHGTEPDTEPDVEPHAEPAVPAVPAVPAAS